MNEKLKEIAVEMFIRRIEEENEEIRVLSAAIDSIRKQMDKLGDDVESKAMRIKELSKEVVLMGEYVSELCDS